GRAGRSGIAVSLVHHAEQGALKRIERFVRSPLPVNVIEGFEPRKTPPRNDRGNGRGRPGGGNGGRRFGGKPGGGHGGHGRSYGGGNGGGWSGKPGASRDGGRRDGQRSSGPRRSNSAS
ncbi:TPA: ATP-dependent helicase, partial [Burkholderia multivorans]|nr:ATP-dependent helicase [Burkholderia multivorans]